MRGFVERILHPLLTRWRRRPWRTPKQWALALLPWILLVAGLLLIFLSVVPEVRPIGSVQFSDSLAPGEVRNETLNRTGFTYAEIAFDTPPPCGVRVFVLDTRLALEYQASGQLPSPETSLSCERTEDVHSDDISLVVFENVATVAQSFSIRFDLLLVSHPYALLALPAFVLFLLGAMVVVMEMIRGGLVRIVDELAEEEVDEPPRPGGP